MMTEKISVAMLVILCAGCGVNTTTRSPADPELRYSDYKPASTDRIISRSEYMNRLQGFWLAECIANWSGLITEMDKVSQPFYTDENWGGPDERNIWGNYGPAKTIAYFLVLDDKVWGADDDTDIEYMYQHLLDVNNVSVLTPEQIRDGWLKHIKSKEENYLWVSNEAAFRLMEAGMLPPATSEPENNKYDEMIDAQLTTEIFGFFAPTRPDVALKMAHLPIRVTAKDNAAWASEFYVTMYSLASSIDKNRPLKDQVFWLAEQARKHLPETSYVATMYDFVKGRYDANPDKDNWEATRDEVYERYQRGRNDGYSYNQSFDSGINFAASLVSLFYGEGDLRRTIRIGMLTGWDSDNPTATWGGLLGFILGKDGVEKAFETTNFSEKYSIHRTRQNFSDYILELEGEDTFSLMAERGVYIIDRVVMEEMGGGVDLKQNVWYIPADKSLGDEKR